MLGSEFVSMYAPLGLAAWEGAAVALAKQGSLAPWPWVDLTLSDGQGHSALLKVQSDVLAVGTLEDHVRLPLTPRSAQTILNVAPGLAGSLLPTPWLVYQMWRAAPAKMVPISMPVNADLRQWLVHSQAIDRQLAAAGARPGVLVSGIKKHVVVSNIYRPHTVLIQGWYRPDGPDVFDDGTPWFRQGRQPIQVKSNAHGDFYVDYSHGIQAIGPVAVVDGKPMPTVDLYQHPTLWRLVSNEGPVRAPRYPASAPPAGDDPLAPALALSVPEEPSSADEGLALVIQRAL